MADTNNPQIVTEEILKKTILDLLQVVADNTYEFTEFTSEEIGNLVDLDETAVAELTKVINDGIASKNHVYSSAKTKELIQQSVIESNQYTDDLVANLSNIKLDIVDALPDSTTVDKSTIYILKDSSGGTNNTLNVWSDTSAAFVEVGKLSVSMDNYYTKSEVDAELAKKANADEVLKPDAIVSDLTTTSGSTTLSTAGLKTELDKKANDDEVVKTADIKTTLDESSTNDEVYGGKAIFDAIHESISMTLSSASDVTTLLAKLKSLAPGKSAAIKLFDSSRILFPVTGNYIGTVSAINGNEIIVICVNHWNSKHAYTFRVQTDDTSISLNKICTTSVEDVDITNLTLSDETNYKVTSGTNRCYYSVKNGMCTLSVDFTVVEPSSNAVILCDLPKPPQVVLITIGGYQLSAFAQGLIVDVSTAGKLRVWGGEKGVRYIGSFSYPVAES